MSQFDEREKGEEARFAHNAELQFKAEARRNKLLGIWAAELLSLQGEEARAYAAAVVAADLSAHGEEDVFQKVSTDLHARGVQVPDAVLRQKMAQLAQTAKDQVLAEG